MCRLIVIFLIIVHAILISEAAFGQWVSSPKLPPINGVCNSSNYAAPGFGPCNTDGRSPSIYAGWMVGPKGVEFEINSQDRVVGALQGVKHSYPLDGIWLGASHYLQPANSLGLYIGSWFLIDQESDSTEMYITAPVMEENWKTLSDRRLVDTAVALNIGGPIELLGGFRFDYLSTGFKDRMIAPGAIASATEAEAISYAYLPYMGIQFRRRSTMGALILKFIGAPCYPGNFDYQESINSRTRIVANGNYFEGHTLETGLEFSRVIFGADIGGFFNWSLSRGAADMTLSAGDFGQSMYRLTLDQKVWSAGLKFSIVMKTW